MRFGKHLPGIVTAHPVKASKKVPGQRVGTARLYAIITYWKELQKSNFHKLPTYGKVQQVSPTSQQRERKTETEREREREIDR